MSKATIAASIVIVALVGPVVGAVVSVPLADFTEVQYVKTVFIALVGYSAIDLAYVVLGLTLSRWNKRHSKVTK